MPHGLGLNLLCILFQIEETFSTERINALASCRSEIAGLQVKIETLNAQVHVTLVINVYVFANVFQICHCEFPIAFFCMYIVQ